MLTASPEQQKPGDVTQVWPLMAQLHITRVALLTERKPLALENIASIREWAETGVAIANKPFVNTAQGNPCICEQFIQSAMVA